MTDRFIMSIISRDVEGLMRDVKEHGSFMVKRAILRALPSNALALYEISFLRFLKLDLSEEQREEGEFQYSRLRTYIESLSKGRQNTIKKYVASFEE